MEEAIELLEDLDGAVEDNHGRDYDEAFRMAIEALQSEPNKAVPPSLADVYKWERDIALSQLEEYGIGFAEKKRDDLLEVVRCRDCKWWKDNIGYYSVSFCPWDEDIGVPDADDYCSYGERREDGGA